MFALKDSIVVMRHTWQRFLQVFSFLSVCFLSVVVIFFVSHSEIFETLLFLLVLKSGKLEFLGLGT